MTKPSSVINIPDVIDRFKAYHLDNPCWGSLHIVLDDINIQNSHVEFCIDYANQNNDKEGEALARILLQMSKSQRLKLIRLT